MSVVRDVLRQRGLYLYNKGLVHIAIGTFDGLSGLQTLYLHYNQLSSLLVGLFAELSGLQRLELHNKHE